MVANPQIRKSIYASFECESLHAMAMCTLWQAAGSSIISAAIQNSLSAFGYKDCSSRGSQVEAALIGKVVSVSTDATCFILEGLGKSTPRKPFALVVSPLIAFHALMQDQAKNLSNIARAHLWVLFIAATNFNNLAHYCI